MSHICSPGTQKVIWNNEQIQDIDIGIQTKQTIKTILVRKCKTTFFHMSSFLYDWLYLLQFENFLNIFSPIVVNVTWKNASFVNFAIKKAIILTIFHI